MQCLYSLLVPKASRPIMLLKPVCSGPGTRWVLFCPVLRPLKSWQPSPWVPSLSPSCVSTMLRQEHLWRFTWDLRSPGSGNLAMSLPVAVRVPLLFHSVIWCLQGRLGTALTTVACWFPIESQELWNVWTVCVASGAWAWLGLSGDPWILSPLSHFFHERLLDLH